MSTKKVLFLSNIHPLQPLSRLNSQNKIRYAQGFDLMKSYPNNP